MEPAGRVLSHGPAACDLSEQHTAQLTDGVLVSPLLQRVTVHWMNSAEFFWGPSCPTVSTSLVCRTDLPVVLVVHQAGVGDSLAPCKIHGASATCRRTVRFSALREVHAGAVSIVHALSRWCVVVPHILGARSD